MNNPWPALAVAVALVAIGISLMSSHVRSWRRQQNDPTLEEHDRDYYRRRYRRRMQISAMLAVLGVLIGLGDALLPFQKTASTSDDALLDRRFVIDRLGDAARIRRPVVDGRLLGGPSWPACGRSGASSSGKWSSSNIAIWTAARSDDAAR